ncbi:bifunctional oligoribonuclease/PAP phosphatase NrnA [Texas Phoenix palm phytoplasma]|uniref:Bifunctional oligoribonuclease/PAP phosphatase NrnA n=2 Tax=Texas Phoenix palm phytoplasma TaxID=176709 RepID=A0ABS5BIC5_9MOLU|nr:bifunctional oligoribonuclease/PAP phosphatase NrnA [Texas Phoenix palm phytoplasma]
MKFIRKYIELFDTIIIHSHKNPDGDSYGSQLGLKNIIETNYPEKKVYSVGEVNNNLSFLGKMDIINDNFYKNALVFVVDCGQSNVISDLRYKLGKKIIRIDHHLLIENFGDHQWVDSSFSSCSEMIYSFKEKNDFKITRKGALPLYVGMVTDTGNFRFERVNEKTLRIASELLSYGINIFEIDKKINIQSLNILRYQGYVLNNFIAEKGFIYFKTTISEVEKFNLTIEKAFSIVNVLNNVENYPVWAFIIQLSNGNWKLSIRSLGPKIDDIANKFGGGGHFRACGVIVKTKEEVDKIIILLQKSISDYLKKNNNKFLRSKNVFK